MLKVYQQKFSRVLAARALSFDLVVPENNSRAQLANVGCASSDVH